MASSSPYPLGTSYYSNEDSAQRITASSTRAPAGHSLSVAQVFGGHQAHQTQNDMAGEEDVKPVDCGRNWQADIGPALGTEGDSPYNIEPISFESAYELRTREDPDHLTMFHDFQDAADWRTDQFKFAKTPEDDSLPRNPLQQRIFVKALFKAFKSTYFARDNGQMIDPFLKGKHDNRRVEALCWDILHAIIKNAETGPLLQAYAPEKVSTTCQLTTFSERFDSVVDNMARYKTICKHLYDAPYINVFVDDPDKSSARVESNKRLNAEKAKCMAVGKQLRGGKEDTSGTKRRRTGRQMDDQSDDDDPEYQDSSSRLASSPTTRRDMRTPPRGISTRNLRSSSRRNAVGNFTPPVRSTLARNTTDQVKEEANSPKRAPKFNGSPSAFRTTAGMPRDANPFPGFMGALKDRDDVRRGRGRTPSLPIRHQVKEAQDKQAGADAERVNITTATNQLSQGPPPSYHPQSYGPQMQSAPWGYSPDGPAHPQAGYAMPQNYGPMNAPQFPQNDAASQPDPGYFPLVCT